MTKLSRTDYYGEIIKYCVKNDTKYFSSKWFYDAFPETDQDMLKNLRRDNYIKCEDSYSRKHFVTNLYSELRYLGLCLTAYMKNNSREVKPELNDCFRQTFLSPELIEFLTLTYDLASKEKAGMLDMDIKEVQLLEDYFYLRAATNAIKADVTLPVGSQYPTLSEDD